jgi:anti-sigma regulatory factor (Ser/Thr protein kinase)
VGPVVETIRSGTEWFRVDDQAAAGSVRRAATRLAAQLGFDDARRAEVGIVASELTANVHHHAGRGEVALQVCLRDGHAGVEIVAVDWGPGMADLSWASVDGHSTRGTLGVGLGAIARLSSSFDVISQPQRGTVLAAGLWADSAAPSGGVDIAGVTRPMANEEVCGDALAGREIDGVNVLLVADGLGHGPLAAAASREALAAFYRCEANDPLAVLQEIHRRISHTRGAAIAVATIDADFRRVCLAGIGNISAFIAGEGRRQSLASYPGIIGHQARVMRQLEFAIEDDSVVVLHSDGLSESWNLEQTPGLCRRSAIVIAASLLRDAGTRPDDASVLVARKRP